VLDTPEVQPKQAQTCSRNVTHKSCFSRVIISFSISWVENPSAGFSPSAGMRSFATRSLPFSTARITVGPRLLRAYLPWNSCFRFTTRSRMNKPPGALPLISNGRCEVPLIQWTETGELHGAPARIRRRDQRHPRLARSCQSRKHKSIRRDHGCHEARCAPAPATLLRRSLFNV
jgi:hypothetical protein